MRRRTAIFTMADMMEGRAEFKRRGPLSAITKSKIARALRGKKKGGAARRVASAIVGRTAAGRAARVAGLAGAVGAVAAGRRYGKAARENIQLQSALGRRDLTRGEKFRAGLSGAGKSFTSDVRNAPGAAWRGIKAAPDAARGAASALAGGAANLGRKFRRKKQ